MALVAIDDPALPGLPPEWRPAFVQLFLNLLTDQETARAALSRLAGIDGEFRPGRWHGLPRVRMHLPWPPSRYEALLAPLWPAAFPQSPLRQLASAPLEIASYGCPPLQYVPARILLERQPHWPDPWLARHARETLALLARSNRADRQVALSLVRQHSFNLVAARNQLLHAPLLAPFEARLMDPPGDLEAAAAMVTGLNLRQILALPRIQQYFRHWLQPLPERFAAFQGEVGWRLRQLALDHPNPDSVIPFPQGRR